MPRSAPNASGPVSDSVPTAVRRPARPLPAALPAALAALALALLTLAGSGCRGEPAFTVDGHAVARAEVEAAARLAGVAPDDPQLLGQLVNQELLLRDAAARGVRIGEAAIERELATLADDAGGTEALRERLAARGVSMRRFRDDLRTRLTLQAYADALAAETPVTDAQVRAAYDAERKSFTEPERWGVTLLHYEDAAAAEAARAAITAGADPAALAAEALPGSGPAELSESDSGAERAALLAVARSTPFGAPALVPERGGRTTVLVPERYYRATTPPFEALEPALRAQLEQRATQEALAARLDELRGGSEVRWRALRPAGTP